jgi:hypothetical protein
MFSSFCVWILACVPAQELLHLLKNVDGVDAVFAPGKMMDGLERKG